jgi:hypothetical protein
LRQTILSAITTMISREDPEYILGLSGGDVANLAWAIAKNTDNRWDADHKSAALCMDWIVDGTINKMQSSEVPSLLLSFHPAELSRLVWSVATFQAYRTETFLSADRNAFKFGTIALRTAATNVAAFCTEDLVRTWHQQSVSSCEHQHPMHSPTTHRPGQLGLSSPCRTGRGD